MLETNCNHTAGDRGAPRRAPFNRTLTLSDTEYKGFSRNLIRLEAPAELADLECRVVNQDFLCALEFLPDSFVDLLFLDPPYNLSKSWRKFSFKRTSAEKYAKWMDSWLSKLTRVLKPNASVYICGDWQTSATIYPVVQRHFIIRNRITWEREKGRGSLRNWKNCSEDIWFCTRSNDYHFDPDAVKLKRRGIAPYTDESGKPKDWERTEGGNYRLTYPSNLWTDITVPFWSMPENTDHPTQKSEKLLAKIILASSKPGDMVFDPLLGAGATAVAAKKLGRRYLGIEIDEKYCCWAEKRLALAEVNGSIQGYFGGAFWERNSHRESQKRENITEIQSGLL